MPEDASLGSLVVDEDQSFEEWVADEDGPEAVVAMIDGVRRQATEGSLIAFTDKEFLAHLAIRPQSSRRWSALLSNRGLR